jgi:hypothetical protein
VTACRAGASRHRKLRQINFPQRKRLQYDQSTSLDAAALTAILLFACTLDFQPQMQGKKPLPSLLTMPDCRCATSLPRNPWTVPGCCVDFVGMSSLQDYRFALNWRRLFSALFQKMYGCPPLHAVDRTAGETNGGQNWANVTSRDFACAMQGCAGSVVRAQLRLQATAGKCLPVRQAFLQVEEYFFAESSDLG